MEEEKKQQDKKIFPMWRCNVCGYICARDDAPDVCPICGAEKDRFSKTEETISE
jgi:rubrerythrin